VSNTTEQTFIRHKVLT